MSERAKVTTKTPEAKRENSASQTKKNNLSKFASSPIDQILFLQRTVGNQAVETLLKSHVIQAKLTIGQPGDVYEHEADKVAEQVMRMPDPSTAGRRGVSEYNKSPNIQRMCTECEEELQRQPMEEKEELLQTKRFSGSTPEVTPPVELQINSARGVGQPLPESVRAFFEPRFGQDFSHVKVHTDSQASESANAVNALAYTVGQDVVFSGGQYSPGTESGKKLIAHELTHVVQQTGRQAALQRAPTAGGSPSPVTLTIGNVDILDPNCKYEKSEVAESYSSKGILDPDIAFGGFFGIEPADAMVIADFKVAVGNLRPSTESDLRKYWIPTFDKRSMTSWEIVGFSDCVDWESRNKPLREKRAQSVARLLPGLPSKAAEYDEKLVENTSKRGRALNRSVIIRPKLKPPPPPPPPKKREVIITREEPKTKKCSDEQRRQLSIAFPAAKLMAERALFAVKVSTDKGWLIKFLLRRYFGDDALSHLSEIHAGFSKILSNWKNWEETFDCELQTDCPKDPRGAVGAFVQKERHLISADLAYGTVHVCQVAFAWPNNMQMLSAILLHELSHRLDNTDDKKYCGFSGEGLCSSLSTKDAIDNADSYAQFARDLFNATM